MRQKIIPDNVREKATSIVEQFNNDSDIDYIIRFQGKFLYLDRYEYGKKLPTCRLLYNGDFNNWGFAIFKWSSEAYDPNEFSFPGRGLVDGTIEGAMRAGIEAYSTR